MVRIRIQTKAKITKIDALKTAYSPSSPFIGERSIETMVHHFALLRKAQKC